jgi:hypothetical protein
MLHMFHKYVASVLSGCCICFNSFQEFQVFCKCFRGILQVFQLFHAYVASVSSECFKSRSKCCTCCNVIHPATTDCCSCLGVVHARGARRDGALLGTGCRKRRVMAAGAQAVPARHASVASRGDVGGKRKGCGRQDRGVKWGRTFLGAADASGAETDCSHGDVRTSGR